MQRIEPFEGTIGTTAAESTPHWERRPAPRPGAPNVVIVLVDDLGFSHFGCYGSTIATPRVDALAAGGLRYTNFHVTPLCSPTRAALLTGRNHHEVGMRAVSNFNTGFPNMRGHVTNHAATVAEVLGSHGYATFAVGKWHLCQMEDASAAGPFDQWPCQRGFDRYYGFLDGETDQFSPTLVHDNHHVAPPATPEAGYHLSEDLVDHAVGFLHDTVSTRPDRPFFLYLAFGATHPPHQAPAASLHKYRGAFAHGWDAQREITFARQKELGVIPPEAELTARHGEIPAWDEMPDELKPVLERQMETYAAYLEHTDHCVGRVIDAIDDLGIGDDTLIYYIIGDNGASAEGTLNGTFNEMITLNGLGDVIETPEFMAANIDKWGSPEAYNHYAVGWAWAMDSPFQYTKQVASHWGGTRNAAIVHWPAGIAERGGLRSQFCHVIDIAPTVLEVAGIPEPVMVHGVTQSPYEGTSMYYTFHDALAPERHDLQYFEMVGNRGIYYQGWSAVTKHRIPWKLELGAQQPAFGDDVWELYDGAHDYSQAHDLSAQMPDKLRELQRLWLIEAAKYNVLPMDDRLFERVIPELAGRPSIASGDRQVFYPGVQRITESAVLSIKNKSFQVTAELVVPDGEANGTIIAQGQRFGGWGLMVRDSRARFVYNLFGIDVVAIDATRPIASGTHQVRAEFGYDGGGYGKGGTVRL